MAESTWEVSEPRRLAFDQPVTELRVQIVNGTVNVVGTDEGSARLEISRIEGPPLTVTHDGASLTIGYPDLPGKSWMKWLDRKGSGRRVTVSLAVPSHASVEVGVVGAAAMISGIRGRTSVHGVSGDTTLMRLSGDVAAETVSGNLEAQSVTGALRYQSVSGDLTVVEGDAGSRVRADSVSGDMLIDLAAADDSPPKPADIKLNTVSGEVAIRLPHPTDARVEANTTSGALSNAFDDLRVSGQWGAKKLKGTLGAGTGTLRATTMSGSIALLRRPPSEDGGEAAPADGPAESPAAGPDGPAEGPADAKGKVL
ncbi:DUF4097 domain-containing protein [Streptomyces sp. NPDC014894]|uniref:DUF4097 family beta strand repeat-containing protein n=1 Tax=Streptomyces sp. NPDC014894 TaxID=3364931 RepID=UPI0036F971ED